MLSICRYACLILALFLFVLCAETRAQTLSAPQPPPKPTPTPAVNPPKRPLSELQKAVQEFRVHVGQISSGNGAVKTAGKQNSYTGRLYEYFRNNALDALPHEVRQRGGSKSHYGLARTGRTVSSPVADEAL